MVKISYFKWGRISQRQKAVLTWWLNPKYKDYNGIIADGSIRSGKTVSMGFGFVLWAMETFNRQNFGMCGKTIESFRRNVLSTLKSQLRARGYSVTEHRSENLIVISKGDVANSFYVFGGKDERSQDLIQGITLAGVLFDEVALMPESFVNQATARCSVNGSKFWFNCNPNNPHHWFKKQWINRCKDRKLVYLHFTMADNKTLSEDIVARYEAQYTGVFYKRYIEGLWVAAEGLVYDMFNRAKNVCKEVETEGEYYVSSDFGIQNANVFLLWRKQKGCDNWVILDECYYSGRDNQRQKTVTELVDDLEGMLQDIKPKRVIVDPSAAALLAELRKRGYQTQHALNDVLDGIVEVGQMLQAGRLIVSGHCKNTLKEFESYCWDDKATARGDDRPIKVNDHAMDAIRYFVKTMHLVKTKKRATGSSIFL